MSSFYPQYVFENKVLKFDNIQGKYCFFYFAVSPRCKTEKKKIRALVEHALMRIITGYSIQKMGKMKS